MIRPVTVEDAPALAELYNYYILNTYITFEEETIDGAEMANRISEVVPGLPWLVAEVEGRVVGYAYAGKWKGRCAYRYSVETSIYLAHDAKGQGIGTALYSALLDQLRALPIHAVIGGVALPNPASERLHEKFGFVKVAQFKEVGRKFEQWIDTVYFELLLS